MEAFPPHRRGFVVGVSGGLAGLAVASGPLVGGAVTQGLDWHWIFWLNVPIGVLAVPLTAALIGESRGAREALDVGGVGLVTGGVVALVWALSRGNDVGWTSPETLVATAGGVVLIAAFVRWEARTAQPAVPLRLFARRDFSAGNVASFLMGATPCAAFLVSEEFQFARGFSPLGTGLRLLPFFATPMLVSPLAGALSDRIGRRRLMLAGFLLQAVGYGWVAVRGTLGTGWGELVAALFVAGVGISIDLPTVPTTVLATAPAADLGKASGVNNMAQRFGGVFAVAVGTAVFSATGHFGSPAAVTDGFRPAMWSAVAFAVLGAVAVLLMPARPSTRPPVPSNADALVAA
jgi:MFS family permease